jgi:hypothetical protein
VRHSEIYGLTNGSPLGTSRCSDSLSRRGKGSIAGRPPLVGHGQPTDSPRLLAIQRPIPPLPKCPRWQIEGRSNAAVRT